MNPTELDKSREILNKANSLGITGSGVNALSSALGSATTPTTITSETMGSTEQPINITDPKPSTVAAGVSGRSTALLELDQLEREQEAKVAEQQAKLQENVQGQSDILEQIGLTKKELTTQGQREFGTDVLKDVRKEALGKLKTAQVQELAELKALDTANMTDAGRAVAQAGIRRKYGMDQLQYQLEYSLANDDLVAAEQIINDRITLATEPLYAKLDLQQNVYDQIKDSLTKSEDREWTAALETSKQRIKEVENLEKYKGDIAITASQNGVPIPSYVQAKINRATSTDEVNQILADNGISLAKPQVFGGGSGGGILSSLPTSIQGKLITEAGKFDTSEIVKKYNATVDSLNIVNSIDPNSKNPSDHQTIIYSFAKSLDPDSVVREGEYATIAKYAQSLVSRYKKEVQNALNGTGFLSAEAIANIQETMNNNYNARKPQYDNYRTQVANKIDSIAGGPVSNELLTDFTTGFTPPPKDDDEEIFNSVVEETPESSNWAVNYFRELFD